jgi:hypothetical protein
MVLLMVSKRKGDRVDAKGQKSLFLITQLPLSASEKCMDRRMEGCGIPFSHSQSSCKLYYIEKLPND